MKVYVASSWRNERQPAVVSELRAAGHAVYDFRHPAPGCKGFAWADIDPMWQGWDAESFRRMLDHPVAKAGFTADWRAMQWADAVVLVLPCGRSAHLELGWAVGAGKQTVALLADGEPELMYRMVDLLAVDMHEVLEALS